MAESRTFQRFGSCRFRAPDRHQRLALAQHRGLAGFLAPNALPPTTQAKPEPSDKQCNQEHEEERPRRQVRKLSPAVSHVLVELRSAVLNYPDYLGCVADIVPVAHPLHDELGRKSVGRVLRPPGDIPFRVPISASASRTRSRTYLVTGDDGGRLSRTVRGLMEVQYAPIPTTTANTRASAMDVRVERSFQDELGARASANSTSSSSDPARALRILAVKTHLQT